ncbi:hypothetical protein ACFX1X_038725 [Malus domestica]
MSLCCGGKCGCGSSCGCGSGCNGCGMAHDLSYIKGSTTKTLVMGVAPQKSHFEASEIEVVAENGCKCEDSCTCNPCKCTKVEDPVSDLLQPMDTSEFGAHNPIATASNLIEAARAYEWETRAYDLFEKTKKWRLVRSYDSGCNGCGIAPDLNYMEGSTTKTLVIGVAPQKSHFEASEMGVAAENGCKCGDRCTCNPCKYTNLSIVNQMESKPVIPMRFRNDRVMEDLNITDEMPSPNSVSRQLNNQIAHAKAFVVIAKESNNLQFAWELSAQIRSSQILLSKAITKRVHLTIRETKTAIRDMAFILYQAHHLHYDSATMIMRLQAKIQTLEEQMSSVREKKLRTLFSRPPTW